jgi:glycosyltransferase involved in cell wall biosynthesis
MLWKGGYSAVVTSLWPVVPVMLLCRLLYPHRVRWIHFIHSEIFFSRADRMFSNVAIKAADGVLCDSQAARRLVERISVGKLIEVARPIFSLSISSGLDVPIERNPLHFITWGRIHRQKNLTLAIRFVAELVQEAGVKGDARLLIVGPDEEDLIPTLRTEADGQGIADRVSFVGALSREEIFERSRSYGSFLLSSEHEGICIALTEAMQLGLLPVVTLVGGVSDYCEEGKNCIRLDSANPRRTAERLVGLSRSERDDIVRNARATFSQADNYCVNYTKALDRLINGQ